MQPYFREMPRLLVYETLIHFLDTFRFLAGPIKRIRCRTDRINPAIRGEDYALIEVEFENGFHGVIDANRISGPAPPEITFGTLTLEGERAVLRMTGDGRLWLTEYGRAEREHAYAIPACGDKGDSVKAVRGASDPFRRAATCSSERRMNTGWRWCATRDRG